MKPSENVAHVNKHFCTAPALVLALSAIAGCDRTYESSVSGMVFLDGTKLTLGTVAFHPVAGGPASYAQVGTDGSYSIQTGREQGLKSGDYVVTIEANERPTALRGQDGGPPAVGKLITPRRYGAIQTSGLRFTVVYGRNMINLNLSSQAMSNGNAG